MPVLDKAPLVSTMGPATQPPNSPRLHIPTRSNKNPVRRKAFGALALPGLSSLALGLSIYCDCIGSRELLSSTLILGMALALRYLSAGPASTAPDAQ